MATSTKKVATAERNVPTITTSIPITVGPLEAIASLSLAQISKLTMRDMMNTPRPIQISPPPPAIISRSSTKNFDM